MSEWLNERIRWDGEYSEIGNIIEQWMVRTGGDYNISENRIYQKNDYIRNKETQKSDIDKSEWVIEWRIQWDREYNRKMVEIIVIISEKRICQKKRLYQK